MPRSHQRREPALCDMKQIVSDLGTPRGSVKDQLEEDRRVEFVVEAALFLWLPSNGPDRTLPPLTGGRAHEAATSARFPRAQMKLFVPLCSISPIRPPMGGWNAVEFCPKRARVVKPLRRRPALRPAALSAGVVCVADRTGHRCNLSASAADAPISLVRRCPSRAALLKRQDTAHFCTKVIAAQYAEGHRARRAGWRLV